MLSSKREHGSRCLSLPMARQSMLGKAWARSASAALMDFPTPKVSSAHATMPSRARPICCGLMAMLPRASGSRHDQPSRARWRVRPASTEVSIMALSTSSNFAKPDDAFRAVVEAHRGLSDAQSADLDAALVLILANHIGDLDVLREAIALAQRRMLAADQQQQQQQQQ